ncbi:MAG TPA: hypothetical protein VFV34_23045, partial [Blastocatellia bacterium]|nr:hypothetical protein [Blastocatellia bacterium]
MTTLWITFTNRAAELASNCRASGELLAFYARLLEAQAGIFSGLAAGEPVLTGELEKDLPFIRPALRDLLGVVQTYGPETLATEARGIQRSVEADVNALLLEYWSRPDGTQFFGKAL